MDQLKEYKKIIKIACLECHGNNNSCFLFEVKFEQASPHRLFKYEVDKNKQQLEKLYTVLSAEIFDLENPLHSNFINNLTKPSEKTVELINQSLQQCTNRLDILTNHYFISFFSIHIHYPDFCSCMKEDLSDFVEKRQKSKIQSKKEEEHFINTSGIVAQRPWLKNREGQRKIQTEKKMAVWNKNGEKQNKQQSEFQSLIHLVSFDEQFDLNTQQKSVVDLVAVKFYQSELLIIIEECQKTTKISNFLKSFFTQPKAAGFITLHKKQGKQYKLKERISLQAQPIQIQYNPKTNMAMILSEVGIYTYLVRMQNKQQKIQLFAFISMIGITGFVNNIYLGEIYIINNQSPSKLHVYGLKDEKLSSTEYKFKQPKCLCYELASSRLFVSDSEGIYIYLISGGLDIKKLHYLKLNQNFKTITQKNGYLFCLNDKGVLSVIEIKPVQKQQLMSILTNISVPLKPTRVEGSKKKRLIISFFGSCVVLIDTIEGPLFSYRLKHQRQIKSILYDSEREILLAITIDGILTSLKINQKIQ